jgi:hypothetical protein
VLLAVDGPENESKGDDDASEWLPDNRRFACAYVATQIFIKTEYRLSVTRTEHEVNGPPEIGGSRSGASVVPPILQPVSPEARSGLRAELDRVGVSYAKVGAAEYVQEIDLGEIVWLKGPPTRALTWKGRRSDFTQRVRGLRDDAGPERSGRRSLSASSHELRAFF